jgi:hypothetical protein
MGGHVPFFRGGYGDDRRLKKKKERKKDLPPLGACALVGEQMTSLLIYNSEALVLDSEEEVDRQ